MENIVEIEHISKSYSDFKLKDVSLNIKKGTIMGFIGENGAGKTTLIKSILQLITIDQGTIRMFGKDMKKNEKLCKEDVGVVLAGCMFPEGMKAVQVDNVMKNIFKTWDHDAFMQYLNQFKLPKNKNIKDLSTGMRMKLSLATALSHHPKLLILDEATSGLDPVARDEILDIFLDFIQDEEHSVFISSHITSDIEKLADYVTFIHEGEILLSEEKDILLDSYGILKAKEEQFESLSKADYVGYRKSNYSIEVMVRDREDIKRRFPQAIIDAATLEEILLYTVKGVH